MTATVLYTWAIQGQQTFWAHNSFITQWLTRTSLSHTTKSLSLFLFPNAKSLSENTMLSLQTIRPQESRLSDTAMLSL
jgi:hypothetical protein